MAFNQNILDRIRENLSLADLISESVQLKRSGRNLSGLCPFHSEKTPSFNVNDEQGYFKCFGCGKRGSIFDFVMETRGLSFPEAVKFLARRAGVELPEESGNRAEEEKRRRALLALREVMREAVTLYQRELQRGGPGAEYLTRRRLTPAVIQQFGLGYAPDRDLLVETLKEKLKGYFSSEDELLSTLRTVGLVTVKEGGRRYDTFRGRLLFPISKSDGSPIAIGGRILIDVPNRPKYINSCESPLYSKSKTLYGLSQALPALRKTREAFLVEGYVDVMSMHSAGYENVVAACGTAVTADHVKVFKRFVDRVVAVFDGDSAGRRAAASCFETFLNSGIDVQGVVLPQGEDPGSLVEQGKLSELESLLRNKVPIVDLYIAQRLEGTGELGAAAAGRIATDAAKLLRKVTNPVEREFLLRRISEKLQVNPKAIESLVDVRKPEVGFQRSEARRSEQSEKIVSREEAKNTPHPKRSSRPLDTYCHQLLVAVVTEPLLGKTVLELSSISGAQAMSVVPASVRSAITELSRAIGPGVASMRKAALSETERDEELRWIVQILDRHGLPTQHVLSEAFRQVSVGGSRHDRVIAEAAMTASRMTLQGEVEKIRESESGEQNTSKLAQLAQEKLLKKRSIERIKRGQ